jgi:hypothetical protein
VADGVRELDVDALLIENEISERDSVMADREGRGVVVGRGTPKTGFPPFRGVPRPSTASRTSEAP